MKHPAPARRSHFFALAAAGLLAPAISVAADPVTQNFDIPSQALSSALTRFPRQPACKSCTKATSPNASPPRN